MYNNKIYRFCIPCSGTGRITDYEYNTRYDSISRSYQRVRQRVTKTCYRCSGNGKVVDQIATKEYQRQQRIKQQKIKQEEQKRIQNQKKQAEYKEFTFKNNMWEQYVDKHNKEITQPLLGQKDYQKVEEKPSKPGNFKLDGKKYWQNYKNKEESYVVCGYCDGKGYDLMNFSQKCRGCGGSRQVLINNTISLQKSPYANYIPPYTQPVKNEKQNKGKQKNKQGETSIPCGVCDGKGYDLDDVTKKCKKCGGSGGKKIKNNVSSFSQSNSYIPLPNYQPSTYNNPPSSYQNQTIVSKKKTEQQLRKQFQKMYEAQKRRLKRLQQQKRQKQQRERRKREQSYKKIRQKQEQQKAIKQQQFYQSPQGRAYVEEQRIQERRRQRKNCIKNALQTIFCCCGQPDDNRCLCWFLILGMSFVLIMWLVVYPIIVSS